MTLQVRTARISYAGPDRLDITRKSADDFGLAFAPSWKLLGPALQARAAGAGELDEDAWRAYVDAYFDEMRASYRNLPADRPTTRACPRPRRPASPPP